MMMKNGPFVSMNISFYKTLLLLFLFLLLPLPDGDVTLKREATKIARAMTQKSTLTDLENLTQRKREEMRTTTTTMTMTTKNEKTGERPPSQSK